MRNIVSTTDAWVTALVLAFAMVAAWGIGLGLGRRLRSQERAAPSSKFEDAGLALLGLLLAFTFSMALGKHERRREALVEDSNAIGDFYTCATLLKDPVRTRLQGVIRDYTEIRLDTSRHPERLDGALPKFDRMTSRMTDLVAEAIHEGTPIAVPLTNTLNQVTSSQASRLSAVRDRLQWSIVALLFLAAMVSTALIGRHQAAGSGVGLADTLSFILIVVLVVYVTLDLNQPHRGLITVSQEPFERPLASMGK